jgi:hypothetical protein
LTSLFVYALTFSATGVQARVEGSKLVWRRSWIGRSNEPELKGKARR